MTQGGFNRGNIAALAQLTLSAGVRDPERLAIMADASRQLGDLDTAKQLLGSVSLPEGASFASARTLASILRETGYIAGLTDAPLPTPFVRRADFLAPDRLSSVKQMTSDHLGHFVSSEIHDGTYVGVSTNTRRSVVLPDPDMFRTLFLPALFEALAGLDLSELLRINELALDRVELQVTAHGDSAYFKPHTDASHAANAGRELSFVFYYRLEDEGFRGGDLKLFDSSELQDRYASESYTRVEPDDNSLILFPSRCVHEVSPVEMAQPRLSAGRFSLNGWIHRRRS